MSAQKYKYTNISELTTNPCDVNFYGIIYDATFPLHEEPNNYICTLKIIDTDINCKNNPNTLNNDCINLIIKSNQKESLPYVHCVGDIIRVHRGLYRPKKKKNLYLNLTTITKINSSWCIFSGASDFNTKDYTPLACSSNNYTFEAFDRQRIDFLRSWIKIHFKERNSLFYGYESKLANRHSLNTFDNDVTVQVIYKTELEDKVVYFVQDETDGCELHTFKYFNFLDVNDVIRIRSFKTYDKNVLLMNKYSNIIKIPPFMDFYKEFMNRLALKIKALEPSIEVPTYEKKDDVMMSVVESPSFFAVNCMNGANYPLKKLNELTDQDDRFLLEVNVLGIYPEKVEDYVLIFCGKCQNSTPTKDYQPSDIVNNRYPCKFCRSHETKFYYNAMLICRENAYANKLIKLHVSSYDDEGASFFGIEPIDLYKNRREAERLRDIARKISDKDAYVSVLVDAYPTNNGESDRVYRIVGIYQNNFI